MNDNVETMNGVTVKKIKYRVKPSFLRQDPSHFHGLRLPSLTHIPIHTLTHQHMHTNTKSRLNKQTDAYTNIHAKEVLLRILQLDFTAIILNGGSQLNPRVFNNSGLLLHCELGLSAFTNDRKRVITGL